MVDTLPRQLTPALRAFCAAISSEVPVYVPSTPSATARMGACFDNVSARVSRHGGGTAYGWAIWNLRGAYFEAEHHGVWKQPSGQLLDVSPQLNNYASILFLPDRAAVYDPCSFRSNVITSEPGSKLGPRIAALAKERNAILNSYRTGHAIQAVLSLSDQIRLGRVTFELQGLIGLHLLTTES
jgi:hypothetical protein